MVINLKIIAYFFVICHTSAHIEYLRGYKVFFLKKKLHFDRIKLEM